MVSSSHCFAAGTSGVSVQMRRLSALKRSTASKSVPWKPTRFISIRGFPLSASRLTMTQFGIANTWHSTPYAWSTRCIVSSTRKVSAPHAASS